MPVTPYAKLLVSVNGGATTSGGLTVTNGDVIQLSGESTVGWTQQRWEIYSFYSTGEFPPPAGWTNAGSGVYFSTAVTPPPFTLPAATAWGKWLQRLTVNGGLRDGVSDPTLKDESTALSIPSPSGLEDMAYQEGLQFDSIKKWVGDHQANLRVIEGLTGGAGPATPLATPSTIMSRDGSANTAVNSLTTTAIAIPEPASFSWTQAQNTTGTGNDATFTGQRGKAGGAFIGGGFTFVTGLSGDGTTPSGNFQIDLGAEGAGGDSGRSRWVSAGGILDIYSFAAVWQIETANGFVLKATGATTAKVQGPAGFLAIDATAITLSAANLGINGGADFGSGTGVVSLANAAVDPTVNPTGGVVIYASGGAAKCRGSGGTVTTFGPAEPHCPTCGRDFAHEWRNDGAAEHLAVCIPCMLGEMAKAGLNTDVFAFINTLKP